MASCYDGMPTSLHQASPTRICGSACRRTLSGWLPARRKATHISLWCSSVDLHSSSPGTRVPTDVRLGSEDRSDLFSVLNGSSSRAARADRGHRPPHPAVITGQIKACRNWRELQQLVSTHRAALNHIHVTAIATRLANLTAHLPAGERAGRLGGTGGTQEPLRFRPGGTAPGGTLQQYGNAGRSGDSGDLSPEKAGTLDGTNERGVGLDGEVVFRHSVIALVGQHCGRLDPRGVANVTWAVARLLPAGQYAEAVAAAAADLPHNYAAPGANGSSRNSYVQQSSNGGTYDFTGGTHESAGGTHGSAGGTAETASGGASDAAELVVSLVDRLLTASAIAMPSLNSQELSNLLWAVATLGAAPSRSWLQQAVELTRQCVLGGSSGGNSSAQSLSNTIWALSKLQAPLTSSWLQDMYCACIASSSTTSSDVSSTANSSSSSDSGPGRGVMTPQGVANVLTSVVAMTCHGQDVESQVFPSSGSSFSPGQPGQRRLPPPPLFWTSHMLSQAQAAWPPVPPVTTASLPSATPADPLPSPQPGGWRGPATPPATSSAPFAQLSPSQRSSSAPSPSLTASSPSRQPSRRQAGPSGGSADAQALSNVAWAAAHLVTPSLLSSSSAAASYGWDGWDEGWWDEWCQALLAATLAELHNMTAQQLSNTLWAVATLRLQPCPTWWDAAYGALAGQLSNLTEQGWAVSSWAIAKLDRVPPASFLRPWGRQLAGRLPSFHSGRGVAMCLSAAQKWGLAGHGPLAAAATSALAGRQPSGQLLLLTPGVTSPLELVNTLVTLARLRSVKPATGLLNRAAMCLWQSRQVMPSRHLAACAQSLARLGWRPSGRDGPAWVTGLVEAVVAKEEAGATARAAAAAISAAAAAAAAAAAVTTSQVAASDSSDGAAETTNSLSTAEPGAFATDGTLGTERPRGGGEDARHDGQPPLSAVPQDGLLDEDSNSLPAALLDREWVMLLWALGSWRECLHDGGGNGSSSSTVTLPPPLLLSRLLQCVPARHFSTPVLAAAVRALARFRPSHLPPDALSRLSWVLLGQVGMHTLPSASRRGASARPRPASAAATPVIGMPRNDYSSFGRRVCFSATAFMRALDGIGKTPEALLGLLTAYAAVRPAPPRRAARAVAQAVLRQLHHLTPGETTACLATLCRLKWAVGGTRTLCFHVTVPLGPPERDASGRTTRSSSGSSIRSSSPNAQFAWQGWSPRRLAAALASLSTLHVDPSASSLQFAMQHCVRFAGSWGGRDLSALLTLVATCDTEGLDWRDAGSGGTLPAHGTRGIGGTAAAVASPNSTGPAEAVASQHSEDALSALGEDSGSPAAFLAWASGVLARLEVVFADVAPLQYSSTLAACSKLRFHVRASRAMDGVITAFFAVTSARLRGLPPSHLSRLLVTLSHLRVEPDEVWLEAWLEAVDPWVASLQAGELATLVVAVGTTRSTLAGRWLVGRLGSVLAPGSMADGRLVTAVAASLQLLLPEKLQRWRQRFTVSYGRRADE